MARGRFSAAQAVIMAVAALAVAPPPGAGFITSTLAGEIVSVGSPAPSAFLVGETVTGTTYAPDSAAVSTVISSTQGVHDEALTSFDATAINVTASEGYAASATEGEIAISNNDLNHRYWAVITESPPVLDRNAPDVNAIALDSLIFSELGPTNIAVRDLSHLDSTDSRTAKQFAFDFGSSPNIEAFFVTARSLPLEGEILSGFEPPSIVLFLVGIIGSALACLALSRRALTERKRTGRRSKHMTIQAGNVRRIRHAFMRRHSGTWLSVFLSLLAFAYFLFFGLPSARAVTLYTYDFDALTVEAALITDASLYLITTHKAKPDDGAFAEGEACGVFFSRNHQAQTSG